MIRMKRILACAVVMLCAASGAFAAGGVLLDDLQITNDAAVVFSEKFDSAKLKGWSDVYDVGLIPTNLGGNLLQLNRHHARPSGMWQKVQVDGTGVMTLSAKVQIAPCEEQHSYKQKQFSLLEIVLYSATAPNTARLIVNLNPKEKASRVSLNLQRMQTGEVKSILPKVLTKEDKPAPKLPAPQAQRLKGYGSTTPSPVIQPKTWVNLALKFDPKSSTATVLVDGKQVLSQQYDVEAYKSIGYVALQCTYGDGAEIGK